ncbi:MAG: hypothetical protein JO129_04585 [Candidatus Dependentiae bacterium]|nr:hypothetical protein [Candidatus Dependentiae bacterium]
MKQPVWVLNSSLLVLFFISQLLLFMLQRAIPRRISISPGKIEVVEEQANAPVDITRIYEQDLFGTYQAPIKPAKSVVDETVAAIPKPPKTIIPEIPVEKVPTFFAPLDVVLKGVIFVKDDPASCIAIVQLKKTKEEHNYQVGDLIEDAQILKILSNRIIIVRSNGQQETLYLREEDAISDFNTEVKSLPKSVVEHVSDNKYTINIDEFIKRVHNLGEFINLLDLTTVYKQGKSFGCRIGKIDKDSLGSLLGFVVDDIVIRVDDYYVDDLANRIQLYDHIMEKNVGDMIEVVLYRGNDTVTLLFGLIDNESKNITFTAQETHQKLLEELSKHEAAMQQSKIPKSMVIQHVSQEQADDVVEDAQRKEDVMNSEMLKLNGEDSKLNFDEIQGMNNQKSVVPLHQIVNSQNNSSSKIITESLSAQTLNESDMHQKRLMQEREKLTPALQDMRSKDKNNMMKQSRKNVIFNGMQE